MHSPVLSPLAKMKIWFNTSKNLSKNRKTFPAVCYFTWKKELVSNILWMIVSGNLFTKSNSSRIRSNVISFTIVVIIRPSTLFLSKLKQWSCKQELKLALLGNCLSDLFTEVKMWYYNNFKFVLGHSFRKIK